MGGAGAAATGTKGGWGRLHAGALRTVRASRGNIGRMGPTARSTCRPGGRGVTRSRSWLGRWGGGWWR